MGSQTDILFDEDTFPRQNAIIYDDDLNSP